MPEILWDRDSSILTVAAERSLGSVLRRVDAQDADWVVVVRTLTGLAEVYYYAFRSSELRSLAANSPERKAWSVQQAMDMHEWTSSRTTRGGRPIGPAYGQQGPAAGRVVDFDAGGRIAAIGEWEERVFHKAAIEAREPAGTPSTAPGSTEAGDGSMGELDTGFDLGPFRGGGGQSQDNEVLPAPAPGAPQPRPAPPGALPADIGVTLSAEMKSEIQVGGNEVVDFQIELTSEAAPLAVSRAAKAKPDVPIIVSLSVENNSIEILKEREHRMDPPGPKQPRKGFFLVKGVRAGVSRLAVLFRQGGSELGVISLAVEVVESAARSAPTQGKASAARRDPADDDKLMLLVEEDIDGGQVFYKYTLLSEKLGLRRRLRSKPLLDRGGGPAASTLAFVEHIYEKVTKELPSQGVALASALKELRREARALGASLCQELFDPEVAKVLWPLRNQISLVEIVSWEPYIPWELVRLRDPDSGDIDDRFLAEYGLVRGLTDGTQQRALPMVQWGYLGATFPTGTLPSVGAELSYFTGKSAESLQGHGITPTPIAATRDAFYDALAEDAYDVLHISCHAESLHQSIERANLIIGEERAPGAAQASLVEVDTIMVRYEAKLKQRRPLVFLNGCETGRVGAVLTAWGGWPDAFLRAGAGAFVGSAWAVRDKPAAAFSTAFYNSMLDGKTLVEAASAARASAKKLGDLSWLAFKVYGHPRARRVAA